jgi:transposase-like protein
VALAALRGDKTLTEIAQHYEVHPNHVTEWKRQLLERAADVFDGGCSVVKANNEPDIKTLHAKIGQLALENDFLSGALTIRKALRIKRRYMILATAAMK